MGDRFYNDVELPELPPGTPATPAPGFMSVYARDGKLVTKNDAGQEVVHEPAVQTQLRISGGNSATTFTDYKLRLDFGSVGGSSINPTGTP